MQTATTTPQEQADDRYDAAHDEATAALNVADLFDELTEAECTELVRDSLRGQSTKLFAAVADRIVKRATGDLLAEASRLSRVAPLSYRVRLFDEA
ncbi:hypothetical protein PQQ63_15215 [Paraburkholderia metrosideri]|uniref:Uncharacterized protein n=1 Tax=Paraburkholderia metrosideri TaxID=580937 RepID=A0ABW9DRS8_9BURK